jgi:hypothetical protein
LKPSLTILTTAGFSLLSVALIAFGSSCAPHDSSVGPDTVGNGGSPATTAQGGAPSGGSTPAASGGSATQPASGGSAPASSGGSSAGGAAPAAGGNTSSGGATTSTGGATAAAGGGPVGTAGAADPGGPVTIMAGGVSQCAATPAAVGKLCDGFEGSAPGAADSAFKFVLGAGATGVVDATKPYRGKNSVHLKTGASAFIAETATFNQTGTVATNNEMWGRVFIYFTTTGAPNSHDVFITLEDPTSNLMAAQFHIAGGSRMLLNSGIRFDTPAGDHYQPPMGTGTVNYVKDPVAWHCWEWHTTALNTTDFYIDGKIYAAMSVTAALKWPLPVFRSMSLGFMEFSTSIPTEIWLDEVAVDSTGRIGCNN